MGLALDESLNENDAITIQSGIPVMLDKGVESHIQNGKGVFIDYWQSPSGSGFVVQGGSAC